MKKNDVKYFCIFMLVLLVFSCTKNTKFDINEFKNRPERKIDTFNGDVELSIDNKILSPPIPILNYLNKMDSTDKYKEYILSDSEKQLFLTYFYLLPDKYQQIVNKKLVAVYFIENFLGGGMADFVYDRNGNILNVLYLNPDILNYSLSEWITIRDNASFLDNEKVVIDVNCGDNYKGLLQVLFHEVSHIYDYHYHFTPYMFELLRDQNTINKTVFTNNIWENNIKPIEKYNYLSPTNFSGWGQTNKIDKLLASDLIIKLSKTPFSSLYGSTGWTEDFAETFTWWYLHQYFNIEYVVKIYENNQQITEYCPTRNQLVQNRYYQFPDLIK